MGPRHWDLRLVPAAVTSWLVAIGIWALGIPLGWILALAVGVVVASGVSVYAWPRWTTPRTLLVLVTTLATGIVALATAFAVAPQREGPLAQAAAAEVVATADLTIEAEVQRRDSPADGRFSGAPRYEVRARLHRFDSRLGSWSMDAPVLLRVVEDDSRLAPGSTVQVTARVRPADFTPWAAAVLQADRPVTVVDAPSWTSRSVHAIRIGLRDSVKDVPADAAALIVGLAVGDESTQPEGLGEAMRVSGLAHLTAVSGGNVAIVLGAIVLIGRLLGAPVVVQALVGAGALLGYVAVVGPQPSVLRAAGMGVVTVMALVVGGRNRGLSALSATVVILLILAPVLAVSVGFALSVAATAGLLVIAPGLRRSLRRGVERLPVPRRGREALADAIALTVAAQIATMPLLASLGQGLSLVSVPANVLAAPAVAPITVLGLLAAISSPILPPLAVFFGLLAAPFAGWIAWLARTFADQPSATLAWPGGLLGAGMSIVVVSTVGLVVIIGRARHWPLRTLGVLALAAMAMVWLTPPDRAGWPPMDWVAVACDVGQGDAWVVSTGPERAVVIDAGPTPSEVDRCLSDLGVEHVEALVLTHFHADHVQGVPGVLIGRTIGSIMVSPVREPVERADEVDAWAARAGVPVEPVRTGRSGRWGEDVTWQVLWPTRIISAGSIPNNASVVLDIRSRGVRMLLLGDVEPAAQVALRGARGQEAFDVVKLAHHGSRFQDPRLASWTAGRIAVVSVGADNDYGHPAGETLSAWQAVSARVLRTDLDGDVAIVVSGDTLGVVTRR